MGLYNFKERFAPFILDDSKTHTIRAVRVRIAPVERWCLAAKVAQGNIAEVAKAVCGQPVSIFPGTMHNDEQCGGRCWRVEPVSDKQLTELAGGVFTGEPLFVCEHMLEMD